MKHALALGVVLTAALSLSLGGLVATIKQTRADASRPSPEHRSLAYPKARKADQVDRYHGIDVPDPYRWLEKADSEETRSWVQAENSLTFRYLGAISERAPIQRRLERLWNYERYSVPHKEGDRYFYRKNDGLQNQSLLYTVTDLTGTPQVLLDPNRLSDQGTVALADYSISPDGSLMAYGLSTSGSDWMEWKIREVSTGKDLKERLRWIKFSGASWSHDNRGFYYSRYDEPKGTPGLADTHYHQKLYYHRIGTPQSEDVLAYERPDRKDWGFSPLVTEDGSYLVIHVWKGTDRRNRVYVQSLESAASEVVPLLDDFDASYRFIGKDGPVFWFHTDLEAPLGRVIAVDIQRPSRSNWREVIPESAETLEQVSLVNHRFIATYLKDATSLVRLYGLEGHSTGAIDLPGLGTVTGFEGKKEDTETFFGFAGFTTPLTIFHQDLESGGRRLFREPSVDFEARAYETRQVFYRSKDGTRIPMFLTHRKNLSREQPHPTYLYGYGGFNISLTPFFSVANLVWLEMGGLLAVPNLRGGGEYGEEWHQAGTKENKQNVFDDFIAAAEWLIRQGYTRPAQLAIGGRSNGGLLVGAAMTQRPELFGAALPAVGVLDMLRFQKFTIGWAWVSDYGSSEDSRQFKALLAYSPLHNLRAGTRYPATLITTADHDDRVVPAHSYKFAAALQAAQSGTAPVLIRIETQAGHGAGKPTRKIIEEVADRWGFLVHTMKMDLSDFEAVNSSRTGKH